MLRICGAKYSLLKVVLKWWEVYVENTRMMSLMVGVKAEGSLKWRGLKSQGPLWMVLIVDWSCFQDHFKAGFHRKLKVWPDLCHVSCYIALGLWSVSTFMEFESSISIAGLKQCITVVSCWAHSSICNSLCCWLNLVDLHFASYCPKFYINGEKKSHTQAFCCFYSVVYNVSIQLVFTYPAPRYSA